MKFRTMLLTAALVLPLAFDSTPVMAQQRGQDRAVVAQAQHGPSANGLEHRQQDAPPGLMRKLAAGVISVLPAGIVQRFGGAEPAPAPEPEPAPAPTPEPEPEPEQPCTPVFDVQNGVPGWKQCDGTFQPMGF